MAERPLMDLYVWLLIDAMERAGFPDEHAARLAHSTGLADVAGTKKKVWTWNRASLTALPLATLEDLHTSVIYARQRLTRQRTH